MAKKKKNNNRRPGKMAKIWKAVSTFSGIGGFGSGVISADIKDNTAFQSAGIETKAKMVFDYFFGRTIGFRPFQEETGITTERTFRPLNVLNISTFSAGLAIATDWALGKAPSFKYKSIIRGAIKNGIFPFYLAEGIGKIFDPPPASPAGTGRIVSRVVEVERGLN